MNIQTLSFNNFVTSPMIAQQKPFYQTHNPVFFITLDDMG
jgi:hypothetical protein